MIATFESAYPANKGATVLIRIDSLDDTRLAVYTQLTDVQLRNKLEPDKGIFIAESQKVIERALAGGMIPLSFLMEEKWLEPMQPCIERALSYDSCFPVFVAPKKELEQLTGYEVVRGALGCFRRPALQSVEEVVRDAHRVAVLENITNHTNVGAIFRSAAALGVDAILVTPGCYDPLYRRAVRVSMGTVFQIPWTRIGNEPEGNAGKAGLWTEEGMRLLHNLGFKTVAFALRDDSIELDNPQLQTCKKLALVFGTEGDGLATSTMLQCDYTVKIPMAHQVDSLNVAAASAVAFWALRWNRQTQKAVEI